MNEFFTWEATAALIFGVAMFLAFSHQVRKENRKNKH